MHTGRVRSLAIGVSLLLAATAPVLATPGIACAAAGSGNPHAALVVDTGQQVTAYCVALDAPSVDGMRLIELASEQYGLSYRLGFGGRAVCMLAGVGATGADCFGDYPRFWGYFHGTGASGWTWATGSAADRQVADGDRQAWSWGTGDSGTTHGVPPATSIADSCGTAPQPEPSPPAPSPPAPPPPSPSPTSEPAGGGGGGANGGGAGTAGSTGGSNGATGGSNAGGSRPTPSSQPSTSPPRTAAAPTSPAPDVVRAAAASPPASSGPPLGGLLAIGAMASLGVVGWLVARRRRPEA